jgi:hypothetical protein
MKYGNYEYRTVYSKMNGYVVMQLYESDGKFYFISKSPSVPWGSSDVNLRINLLLFIKALDKPVLMFEDILEITALSPI